MNFILCRIKNIPIIKDSIRFENINVYTVLIYEENTEYSSIFKQFNESKDSYNLTGWGYVKNSQNGPEEFILLKTQLCEWYQAFENGWPFQLYNYERNDARTCHSRVRNMTEDDMSHEFFVPSHSKWKLECFPK